ncbi:MAG: hypothetical protein IJ715_03600 [Bacilli bacterium]|nr:hypothetical protein [Bacilli bacterium]
MIYLYTDLTKKGLSDYQIKKMVKDKKLYMIMKGAYSTKEEYNKLELIAKKHPNAVFTLSTACYCYGLVKKNNPPYYIATKQKDRKIKDDDVKQIFMTDSLYDIGANKITYQGFNIMIYDLERLLIEVVRNKVNLDYDIYHEIINSYKRIKRLLNKNKLNDYIVNFKDSKIVDRINKEVFETI